MSSAPSALGLSLFQRKPIPYFNKLRVEKVVTISAYPRLIMLDERISVAPMMEMTDNHCRGLLRGMTKKTVLYTEMVVDDTVNHVDNTGLDFFIGRNIDAAPSVIQLGGSNPETLAQAAYLCEQYGNGYGEINLNCGCPSERVSKTCFGAQLMLDPELVRQIVSSMRRQVSLPITVKCRIGADDRDS